MSPDATMLAHLQAALARHDVTARVDDESRAVPVLWVPIPRTSAREMVLVTYGQRGESTPSYWWDGQVWADGHELAAALAVRVAAPL